MSHNHKLTSKYVSLKENHKALSRRFTAFYGSFFVIILILFIYLHHTSVQKSRFDYWHQNEITLNSSVAIMDNQFAIIDNFCRQILQNSEFSSIYKSHEANDSNFLISGYKLKSTIGTYIHSNKTSAINSFFLFFKNTDYVASVNTFHDSYLHYIQIYPDINNLHYDEWHDLMYAKNNLGTLYSTAKFDNSKSDDGFLYLVDIDEVTYKSVPVTAGFHLSTKKIYNTFSNLNLEKGAVILIMDGNGNFCTYLNSSGIEDISPFVAAANTWKTDDITINNEKYHLIKTVSSQNDYTYYLLSPSHLSASTSDSYYIFSLIIILVLGFSLIFVLVRTSIQPIVALDDELQETKTDRDQLQEMVNVTKPIIYNTYLKQLMLGSISSQDELLYTKQFLHLDNQELRYHVLYCVLYEGNSSEGQESCSTLSSETIEGLLAQYFTFNNNLYLYNSKKRIYSILIPFEGDSNDELIRIQEKVLSLHQDFLENHSVWFFAGLGLACSYEYIWESFQQAKDASNYTSKNYIFLPYAMLEKNSSMYYYPSELSSRMTQFISNGNKDQIIELFDLIHKENIEDRSLPYHLLKFLLSDIRNTLLKSRYSLSDSIQSSNNDVLKTLDELFTSEDISFQDCETIALKMCELNNVNSEKLSLIDSIVEYINLNYKDPSMGLNKISDKFHISESYFSHLFKEEKNVNFSVYLEDLRLNEAVRLMKEGKSNLTDISEEVGYNNLTSFRRAFKKKFGVTPSAMSLDK